MEHVIEESPTGLMCTVQVRSPLGLHARPAARVAQVAQNYTADIVLRLDDVAADAKSILDILSLAASQGTKLTVEASGSDAREAITGIAEIFTEDTQG
ncbi:MAG: HPr family phosphocarrier protein [Desulfovibrionaceae bacterium]